MKYFAKILAFFLTFFLSGCLEHKNTFEEKKEMDDSFSENLKKLEFPEKYQLKEVIIGNPAAPSTVVVYSSFTCDHCREFHEKEFPKFKKKHVDSGKVKVYLRNYLDDLGALESAIIMRCLGEKSSDLIIKIYHEIFSKQTQWLKSTDPRKFLKNIFINHGHDMETIDACLTRRDIPAGLMKEQQRAMHQFGIVSVPAFIINGKVHSGKLSCEQLEKMLETGS